MAEAPQRPPDPLTALPQPADVIQPTPPRSRLPRVGVVLAAGQSQRLASVTGGGSKALLRLGGLSLVERAVRSLMAAGLERVLVVVGHDAGPVATVVGALGATGSGRRMSTGGPMATARRWPQSNVRSRVRRCSCW
jgi:hypothetical protein